MNIKSNIIKIVNAPYTFLLKINKYIRILFKKYVSAPIATLILIIKCRNNPILIYRYLRFNNYILEKLSNNIYKKNMKAIVKMSEDFCIPQHEVIRRLENSGQSISYTKIRYKSKNGQLYGNIT